MARITIASVWQRARLARWSKLPSAKTAESCMANVCRHLGSVAASRLTTPRLEAYVAAREAEGAKGSTVNRELGTLRAALLWATDRESGNHRRMLDRSAIPSRWPLQTERAREVFLEPDEARDLAACMRETDAWAADVLDVLLGTGCRVREVLGAPRSAFRLNGDLGALRLVWSAVKERRAKSIPLVGAALVAARARVADETGPSRPFSRREGVTVEADYRAFARRLARLCEDLGWQIIRPHDLRRTAATTLLNAGAPLEAVAELLGHQSLETTRRYVRMADRKKGEVALMLAEAYR